MLAGEALIVLIALFTHVAFLWYNVIGAVAVVVAGLLFSGFTEAPTGDGAEADQEVAPKPV
jgi:hypothetical protein